MPAWKKLLPKKEKSRHDGYVNCLFMDWSARKIGLKELWKLKWHGEFDEFYTTNLKIFLDNAKKSG